ncbi:porin [Pokkaliibacter sp. CJK22405]|uniref:porin n=1 Tax=Pokkaliibacter sp. CJK22405 TaxID=3384615 RepID=UPI003984C4FB
MKKSIIALAVAGALAAPAISMADATLYGRIHERVVFQESNDAAIQNAGHRLGVKGESEMDSGLTAFYQLETEYQSMDDTASQAASGAPAADLHVRLAFAGVKGDFGTVTVGRLNNPYSDIYTADIFEYNSGIYEASTFRLGNAITYATPDMNGFGAAVGLSATGEGDSDTYNDADSYLAQVHYSANGLTAVAAYQSYNSTDASGDTEDDYGLGLSYTVNNLLFAGYYEHSENDASEDVDNWDLAVQYTMDKTKLGFLYGESDKDSNDEQRAMVGVYHDLGGGADIYAEYGIYDDDNGTNDDDNVVVGYRIKF